MIDFLKVLLIFFPGCSDRTSLASLAKNLWEVDLPQVYVIKCFSWMYLPRNGTVFDEMPLWNTFHKGKALPALKSWWQAQNMGVCLFGGRGRRAKSPSPFRLPWRASDYPSRRTRSSHLAFHLQKIPKWRQLEPVKSIRKKAPKKMFPRSFKVRIFWSIFCWRCVN